MNRQGQCAHIISAIDDETISKEDLDCFWDTVDSLDGFVLRDLPDLNSLFLRRMEKSFDEIRQALRSWHPSSGSLCFLTKVILMFNWGQSPAFDKRIRSVLRLRSHMSCASLVKVLAEIGAWIRSFESQHGTRLDQLATAEMRRVWRESAKPLPLGRSFDMLLFSLT